VRNRCQPPLFLPDPFLRCQTFYPFLSYLSPEGRPSVIGSVRGSLCHTGCSLESAFWLSVSPSLRPVGVFNFPFSFPLSSPPPYSFVVNSSIFPSCPFCVFLVAFCFVSRFSADSTLRRTERLASLPGFFPSWSLFFSSGCPPA